MKNFTLKLAAVVCLLALVYSCKTNQTGQQTARYPDWAKNAVIYEVNVRQYTPEGTFKAFEAHLPRLKELGVDILWMMPIHPIGIEKRKFPEGVTESLGSYYSVKDYKGINPEFGTEADFKALVEKAHSLGFKVIIDWVANHSAWDNAWVKDHPDWYVQDSAGNIMSAFDWTDVAKLNYANKDMRKAMVESMKYWLEKCDIDGFRCDVAGEVPADFWNETRPELEKVKPVFMLAENEDKPELFKTAFDAAYNWAMSNGTMVRVYKGEEKAPAIIQAQLKTDSIMPEGSFKMSFITNHDENSWNSTASERFGPAENTFALLTYALPGMPLIYSGQEAGLNHRLQFFIKDSIDWKYKDFSPFYKKLNALKHENEALWNPPFGGSFKPIENNDPDKVLSFIREKGKFKVLVIANLSAENVTVNLKGTDADGEYTDVFSGSKFTLSSSNLNLTLQPWGYWIVEAR
ncbi:MAG: alpha-glucosidase C-terminal domain-containing protein [Bacteroidales bacterium]|nr:alpha-glucosidase C-terminal domain-containing protein [Bacteroidales bacterium]